MARPLSDDRRAALLDAAVSVFAEHGLAAPTSAISRQAKVSEGSLFTYFKTKDELINAVFRDLRHQLADAVMPAYPRRAEVRERFRHLWTRYVTWGAEHPAEMKVMRLTQLSSAITADTRAESDALLRELEDLRKDACALRKTAPVAVEFAGELLKALGEMTMGQMIKHPQRKAELRDAGFGMLWAALTNKE